MVGGRSSCYRITLQNGDITTLTTLSSRHHLVAVCKGSAIGRKLGSLADHKDFFMLLERPLHTASDTSAVTSGESVDLLQANI